MLHLSQQVLRTDLAGLPLEWVDYRVAARLYCLGQVAYAYGILLFPVFELFLIFLIMAVVLLVKPQGLFGGG